MEVTPMAGKQRKRKPVARQREDLSKPNVWRRQHGGFTEAFRDADPDTGAVVSHRRAIDLLARLEAMRRRAWHQHGVAALAIDDISDVWLRQALINEATRRWGPRNGGHGHGR